MMIGPIAQYHANSKYYSAIRPLPNPTVDRALPHITIQMPIYKEGLDAVLAPSIQSIKKAMKTYARQGGTSTIFINDDGLQLLPPAQRGARIAYYANHGIGWVARPPHSNDADGFKRAGRFKKASNMNYALELSLKLERHLESLINQEKSGTRLAAYHQSGTSKSRRFSLGGTSEGPTPSTESNENDEMTLEDRALLSAVEEVHEAAGRREGFKPWAANGRAMRIGEIILLVDSDTIVPEDCLRDAAREMAESPQVAIIQHESGQWTLPIQPLSLVLSSDRIVTYAIPTSQTLCRSPITTLRTVLHISLGGLIGASLWPAQTEKLPHSSDITRTLYTGFHPSISDMPFP